MSLYHKLSRKPKLFLSITGMNLHRFQGLLPQFTAATDKSEQRRKRKVVFTGQKRLRQIGGGAQFANAMPDRLLMLLGFAHKVGYLPKILKVGHARYTLSSIVFDFMCKAEVW